MTHKINPFQKLIEGAFYASVSSFLFLSTALAGPNGGQIEAGIGSIDGQGTSNVIINQSSNRIVINWNSFNTAAHESVEFRQSSSSALAINRINNGLPTEILGSLRANGQVVVINPNGVILGSGANVDVNKLVVSTADIATQNAMHDDLLHFNIAGNPNAKIINNGTITAGEAGLVGLIAPHVENSGIIQAKFGKIKLASGSTFTLDLAGDDLVSIAVSDDVAKQLVVNSGTIKGDTITITAAMARQAVDKLLVNTGVIEAKTVAQKGGTIILGGDDVDVVQKGILNASGVQGGTINIQAKQAAISGVAMATGSQGVGGDVSIKASDVLSVSTAAVIDVFGSKGGNILLQSPWVFTAGMLMADSYAGTGGDVRVLGDNLYVAKESFINASGTTGGGQIYVGGDFQGKGDMHTATYTGVDKGALFLNSALQSGDGGQTIIWANDLTEFYGSIVARGMGAGKGGFAEVSGKEELKFQGEVDLTSESGVKGTLLLDPATITVYGNFAPNYVSTDGTTVNLASGLKLWLDAADSSTATLTYSANGLSSATANGTSGMNTITTSVNVASQLTVGARIRLGGAGASSAASAMGADTYTVASISGTTITLTSALTQNYSASTLNRGLVSAWTDKSGTGNNAVQITEANMPLWVDNKMNGKSVIRFDGTSDFMTIADSPTLDNTAGLTLYAVNTPLTMNGNANAIVSKRDNVGVNQAYSLFYYTTNKLYVDVEGNNNRFNTTQSYVANTSYMVNMVFDGSLTAAQRVKIYNNDALYGSFTETNNSLSDNTSALYLGTMNVGYATYLNADYSDVLIYNSALSDTNRQLVDQYLAQKWGLALTPPGTGATEVAKATASNGFGGFTTRYLEYLSQSADINLLATNAITLDLKGDTLALANDRSISFTTTSGNITSASAGTITTNRTGTGGNISFTAGGTGLVNIDNVVLNAQNGGTVSINAGGNVSVGMINSTGTTIQTTGAGSSITAGALNVGVGDLSLTADDLILNGNLTGTGSLILQPNATTRVVNVNNGTDNGSSLHLSAAELGRLSNGWSSINIGRTNGANDVFIGTATWTDPVVFRNNYRMTVMGAQTGSSEASFTFLGGGSWVDLYNSITTAGQKIDFSGSGYVWVGSTGGGTLTSNTGNILFNRIMSQNNGNMNVTSNGGTISIADTIYGAAGTGRTYNFDAGTGNVSFGNTVNTAAHVTVNADNISFNGAWGGSTTLGNVTLTAVNSITMPSINASGITATLSGAASTITAGALNVGSGAITLTSDDVVLNGALSGTGVLTLQPYATTRVLNIAYGADNNTTYHLGTTDIGRLSEGWNTINIGRTNSGANTFIGTATFTDPVVFRSNNRITVANAHTLTGAGNASLTFDGAGSWVDHYGSIVTIGNAVSFNNNRIDGYNGTITTGGGAVSFNKIEVYNAGGDLTVNSGNGAINVGIVTDYNNTATGKSVSLNAGTGTVAFSSTVNGRHNMTVSGGNITFGGAWGATAVLGNVSLTTTNGGLSLSAIRATSIFAESASGQDLTLNGALVATGSGNAVILNSGRHFINSGGSIAPGTGRYLVYSADPSQNTLGGISVATKRYNKTYAAYAPGSVSETGNVFLYSVSPVITVTAENKTKIYGDANPVLTATYGGFIDGDTLGTALTGSAALATGATALSNVGNESISASLGTLVSDLGYTFNYVSGNLSITPAALTVTAENKTKIYGDANPALTLSFSGLKNADDGLAVFSGYSLDTAAVTGSNVGSYGINLTGGSASNYTITRVGGTLTVTPAALTVTAENKTKIYGDANPGLTLSFSGLKNSDDGATIFTGYGLSTTADDASGVGSYGINLTGGSASNYTITRNDGTLTVTPASLTITADNKTKIYGDSNPGLTASYSGFKNGDTDALVSGLALATSVGIGSNVGSYAITAGGATSANYTITHVDGSLSVTPASLTVQAVDESKTYGDVNPVLSLNYSGLKNGDDGAVVFTGYSLTTGATSASNVGTYAINLTGGTASNYTITRSDGTLTVTPASLTVLADSKNKVYGAANPTLTISLSGLKNGDTDAIFTGYGLNTTAATGSNVGSYGINVTGGSAGSNYIVTRVNGTLSVTAANLVIQAVSQTKTYGDANPALTLTYSGLQNGDDGATVFTGYGLGTTAVTGSSVGSYAINLTGGSATNYTITRLGGTLSITPAALTILADSKTKIYGDTNPTFTATYIGLKNGDGAGIVTGLGIGTSALTGSDVGSYTLTPSGASAGSNYTVSYANGTLNIIPAALTVQAVSKVKTYGDANPALTLSYTGLKNSDDGATVFTGYDLNTAALTGSNVGSYAINLTGGTAGNYTVTRVGGTLTVTPAALTVQADSKTKVYGDANPGLTLSFTGLKNGDATTVFTGYGLNTSAGLASDVGTYGINLTGGTAGSNYTVTRVNGNMTVTPASLVVMADAKVKTYGDANPGLTLSFSGLKNSDTGTVFTGYGLTTGAVTGSNVGSYAINLTGGSADNYTITRVGSTLTVTPASLTVLADSKVKTYGSANPGLTLSFTGLKNGDTSAVFTGYGLTTGAVTGSNVGSYAINLTGGTAGSNYTVTRVGGNITVTPATLIVTADDKNKTQGDPNPGFTLSYAGLRNGDLESIFSGYSLSSAATNGSAAGNYTIVLSGGSAGSNYNVTRVNGMLIIAPGSSTVTPGVSPDGSAIIIPYKSLWQPPVPSNEKTTQELGIASQDIDKPTKQQVAAIQGSCLYQIVSIDGSVSFGSCGSSGK